MILLIDAGNTWMKWTCLAEGRLGPVGSCVHYGVNPAEWQRELAAAVDRPARVVVANVSGSVLPLRLTEWTRQHWQLTPEYPRATRMALGVRNSYEHPEMLAIDRWLAMVAAWQAARAPLVVVCAGTALTIDLLDVDGAQRGWHMVPGARLMREALHAQTRGVAAAALLDSAATDGVFGINTAGCVQQGARLALASFVDRVVDGCAQEIGGPPAVYVTGGAAPQVSALMQCRFQWAPDLVLRGLSMLLSEAA